MKLPSLRWRRRSSAEDDAPAVSPRRTRIRRQRIGAALAAGLVLGLGAASTLAEWSAHQFVGMSVQTGDFIMGGGIQVNASGSIPPNDGWMTGTNAEDYVHMYAWDTSDLHRDMGPGDNAVIFGFVRIDPVSAGYVESANLHVDGLVGLDGGPVQGPNVENIAWEVYLRAANGNGGCSSLAQANNPPATIGTLVAYGDSLDEINHVDDTGWEVTRTGNNHRVCLRLMAGSDLVPNDELDIVVRVRAEGNE
ncbi:hypothetical protein [Nesterenkonia alba]|uniref:hypothetical protein n=1 Tax=Nesterenkonia alba TaxID=515814 RepID=UPI0012EC4B91|nr:hypothetical protein [Nesterenkonia alba]